MNEFNFPSKYDYKPIDTSKTLCELIEAAKAKQPMVVPIREIELEYDSLRKGLMYTEH